jgi:hypothetical protein
MGDWRPIETAPRDGRRFWGACAGDAISMLWHDGFGAFVSSWRRMELARGMTFADTGLAYQDHSPVTHSPTHWMPEITPPSQQGAD